MNRILLIIFILASLNLNAQKDQYDQLKIQYDDFRKLEKHDSALYVAKQLNTWALQNETDTSLLLADAMRYIGNSYRYLEKFDTSILILQQTLLILERQKRLTSRAYTETLNGLAISYKGKGEYQKAENCYLKAIEIRTKFPTKLGDKPRFLNNLGYLYVSMGMYLEAEIKITEALTRFQQLYPLPEDSIKYINMVHSLAAVKFAKGEYEDAEKLFGQWKQVSQSGGTYLLTDFVSGCLDYAKNEMSLKKFTIAENLLLLSDSLLKSRPDLSQNLIHAKLNNVYGNYYDAKGISERSHKAFNSTISMLSARKQTSHIEYANACQGLAYLFLKKEKFDSAFFYSNDALEIRKNILGSFHPEYAATLRNIASIYSGEAHYNKAINLNLELLSIYEKIFDPNHKAIAEVNNSIAINYRRLGLYKTSEIYAQNAIRIYEQNGDLRGQALMNNNLGYLKLEMGYNDEAEVLVLKAIDYQKIYYKNDSTKFYNSIHTLACVYQEKGEYEQAETYFSQWWNVIKNIPFKTESKCNGLFDRSKNAMSYSKSQQAKNSLHIADSIIQSNPDFENLATSAKIQKLHGDISFFASHFDTAYNSYLYSSDLLEDLELTESNEYAEIMLGLSRYYSDVKTNYLVSIKYAKQAAELQLGLLGNQHPDYAKTLNMLGIFYHRTANLDSSLLYYQMALKIRLEALGDDHPDYGTSLNNIGTIYSALGLYDKVLPLYEQSLKIILQRFKSAHINVAIAYSNIGTVCVRNSDFKSANDNYLKSLSILEEVYPDSINQAFPRLFQYFATLARALGDDQKQEEYLTLALRIQKKISTENEDYVNIIKNLGTCYTIKKQYDKGRDFLNEAIGLYANMKGIGIMHPNYAVVINDLGRNYLYREDFQMADSLFRYALKIRTQIYKTENTHIAKSNRNIGDVLYLQGNYKDAELYYQKSLQISLRCLNPTHEYTLDSKNSLANCYVAQGRNQEAFNLYKEIFDQKTLLLTKNFEWLNNNEKELYWKLEQSFFEKIASFSMAVYDSLPMAADLNYNALLVSKSILLEAKLSKDNFERFQQELYEEQNDCIHLRNKMEKDGILDRQKFNRITKERDSLERLLNISWPEYALQKQNLKITWDKIQQNLGSDEAAIEFSPYYEKEKKSIYYQALVIKKGLNHPLLVKLCSEEELKNISPNLGFSAYYPLIWEPLEAYLKDIHNIYYSPSGELNNVPFQALYSSKGNGDDLSQNIGKSRSTKVKSTSVTTEKNIEYLMDRFTFHQLTSTRYLAMDLKQKQNQKICQSITLFGGINYDYLPGSKMSSKKQKSNKGVSRSSKLTSEKLGYLEGTENEVEKINVSLSSVTWSTKLIEGNEATLENFMKNEGKDAPCVMHIATHGYAFPEHNSTDTSQQANFFKYNFHYSPNPMVRSGLILAGGNWAWTGSDTLSKLGAENGILTALEVSQLNLKKTKLVVLSACETGLGKIEGSEGTFGLKRGFKLAGVEQIIVSLWSVPDKETMELMTLFYSDLTKTLNPVISFGKAQKEMRNLYPTDPEKWAGFVLVR